MTTNQMAHVLGLQLENGQSVVVKARPDPQKRVITCVAVQRLRRGKFVNDRAFTGKRQVRGLGTLFRPYV